MTRPLSIFLAASITAIAMFHGAAAQPSTSLVEGAVCAHLASQIEDLGERNERLLEEISKAQVKAGSGDASEAFDLSAQRSALVSLRREWINEYEVKCASARLSVTNLKKICRTDAPKFDLGGSVFCNPLEEAGL